MRHLALLSSVLLCVGLAAAESNVCTYLKTSSQCLANKNCVWYSSNGYCAFKPSPPPAPLPTANCSYLKTSSQCLANKNCVWYSSNGYCAFKPSPPPAPLPTANCSYLKTASQCLANKDCVWYSSNGYCDSTKVSDDVQPHNSASATDNSLSDRSISIPVFVVGVVGACIVGLATVISVFIVVRRRRSASQRRLTEVELSQSLRSMPSEFL